MKRNVRSIALIAFAAVLIVSVHFTNRYVVEEQEKKGQLVSGISNYCLALSMEENIQICENDIPMATASSEEENKENDVAVDNEILKDEEASSETSDTKETEEVTSKSYTEEDVNLLAHVIYAEIGSDWVDDLSLYYVGSVVINRVKSDLFPNSVSAVVYQEGQYECVYNGHIYDTATDRCFTIARDLLENGSVLPSMVLYQAQYVQGPVYDLRHGMYFCYQG